MRKHQDLLWLSIALAVVAVLAGWQIRVGLQHAADGRGLSRDRIFTLRVQGEGYLMIQSWHNRHFPNPREDVRGATPRLVRDGQFRIDARDGDIIDASTCSHLLPKVSLPPTWQTFAITPDGWVVAETPTGPQRCGRIGLFMGPNVRVAWPGEQGSGKLVAE